MSMMRLIGPAWIGEQSIGVARVDFEEREQPYDGSWHKDAERIIRDGVPENATVAASMTLHPLDYEDARFALLDEIEAMIYRAYFGRVEILRDESGYVPRGHALLRSAQGQAGMVRFA